MTAPGPSNPVARRAMDELVDFSGRLNAMISDIEAMDDQEEVYDSLMCLRDDKRAEHNKLMALNELIAKAEEDISRKETHIEIMDVTISSV
ncbi:hypothetical protein Tco_1261087 [Tanacetum coccineum]